MRFRYAKAARLCLCALLLSLVLPGAAKAFALKLEPGKRVLVMPFDCDIVEAESDHSRTLLQNLILTHLAYALQKENVVAMPVTTQRPPQDSTALANLIQAGDQAQSLARRILGRMGNQGREMSGTAELRPPSPLSEEENALLAPPISAESRRAISGIRPVPSDPVDDSPVLQAAPEDTGTARLGLTPPAFIDWRTRAPGFMLPPHLAADSDLQRALAFDCDYVLVGNLAYSDSELGASTVINNVERGSVRSEVAISYMLLAKGSGKVLVAGTGFGKADSSVTFGSGSAGRRNVNAMLGRALQQAVEAAADDAARALVRGARQGGDAGPAGEERRYYQDSPGKTLKPEPFTKGI